jgi:putrescine aminotransferase
VKKIARSVFGQWAALRMLEKGFIVQPSAHCWNVVRLEPPLTIGEAEIDLAVNALGEVLDGYRGLVPLARDVTRRLREQRRRRWEFPG